MRNPRPVSQVRRFGVTLIIVLAGLVPACANALQQTHQTSAHYVEVRDGTRIAIDVTLPASRSDADRHPALFQFTRYGRSREDPTTGAPLPSLGALDRHFLEHGYAVVKVDARGSGASFGTRPVEYGPEEVRDAYDVVEWVVNEPWSDGTAGAYGTSYSGTTAEFLAAVNHPAVKAVIPGWSDFDTYASPVRPYGLLASSFMRIWGRFVGWLDENNVEQLGGSIRRVDEDDEGLLLARALEEHEANPDVFEAVVRSEYRDDDVGGGYTWEQLAPIYWKQDIERSGVPMLVLVSWLDAGTADGALLRFRHFRNPQKLVVMASSHGGGAHASPYAVSDRVVSPVPSVEAQAELRLQFFDHYLRSAKNDVESWPAIRYYVLGEEAFRETSTWPPDGVHRRTLYLGSGGELMQTPETTTGADSYTVDSTTSTGTNNRWMTQMGEPVLRLNNRGEMDARMLTYTTPPLDEDLLIAGTPVMRMRLSSNRPDGAVLVYLEAVDPDGRSRYLTEGGLRLIHRKVSANPYFEEDVPYHTYARVDAEPVTPGAVMQVDFQLWPIAVFVPAGDRLRVAIAGADADTFDPIMPDATLTIHRDSVSPSRVELPVMER